ncbi:hypothetical protein CHUAL_003599 [Chamberlinius hualienensis]
MYKVDNEFRHDVLHPMATDLQRYAYVRRGTKMNILLDQMEAVRSVLQDGAQLQKGYHKYEIGCSIETFHSKVYTSSAPLASLKRATFHDLRLEMPNRGFYVVARVIEPAYGRINFALGIEDENGAVIMLELINMPSFDVPQAGHVIVIKEPYYKLTTRELPAIRCDSPTDITILQRNHPLYREVETIQWRNEIYGAEIVDLSESKTADEWYEEGLQLSRCRTNMTDAINCFLAGLNECSVGSDEWIKIKRAMFVVYCTDQYYEKAEQCALEIRSSSPSCTDAFCFLIDVRINLLKYDEAFKYATKFKKKFKDASDYAKHVMLACEKYKDIAEAYNSASEDAEYRDVMFLESKSNRLKLDDNRNVVTKVKILRNQPIIVAHPLVFVNVKDHYHPFFNYRNYNEIDASWYVIRKIVLSVYQNPKTYFKRIFDFRSSVSSKESPPNMYCDENSSELTIDVERLKDICHTNMFTVNCENEDGKFVGLYGYPSYLKHSCNPNASYKERIYDVEKEYCPNVLYPLATDMASYAYVRRGTKMNISTDQMEEVRTLLQTRNLAQKKTYTLSYCHIGHSIETFHGKVYASTAPLALLKRTTFRDLRLEMSNRNFYVVARLIESPYGYYNVAMGIEDENGDVIILELINFPKYEFPLTGQVIIIKEPYYKLTTRELPAIRCDSPTDLTIIQRDHPLYSEIETIQWKNEIHGAARVDFSKSRTIDEWLDEGLRLHKGEINLAEAVNCYLAGLNVCQVGGDEWIKIKSAMFVMYNLEQYYEKAEQCAMDIRSASPSCNEAFILLIQARIRMQKYEKASGYAKKYSKKIENLDESSKRILRGYAKYKNIAEAYDLASESAEYKEIQCLESKSNHIELDNNSNVIAKVKITRNQPIIVAHPFVYLDVQEDDYLFYNYQYYDNIGEIWFFIREIVLKMYKNPDTYFKWIFGFRSSVSNEDSLPNMYCDENSSELTIDVERHSCYPNASYKVCNGIMLVKTVKDIKKNDLITVDYAQFETDPQKRREVLNWRLISCDCRKCDPKPASS